MKVPDLSRNFFEAYIFKKLYIIKKDFLYQILS